MCDIFDEIEAEEARTLFKKETVFSSDSFYSHYREILHREIQIKRISRLIVSTSKKVRDELYIFGVTGVGKTCTARTVLESVPKRIAGKFNFVWINCKNIRPVSSFQILKEISLQLKKNWGKGQGKGLSTKDLENEVINKHKQKPLLVVLDEVDTLVSDKHSVESIIYTFMNANISLVMISNKFNWTDDLDPRIRSRAKTDRIDFNAYTKEEMYEILKSLVKKGVKPGVINDELLREIAEEIVDRYVGDVRKGKYLIYSCVRCAMVEGAKKVTEDHLIKAYDNVEPMSLEKILESYSKPELVALAAFVAQQVNRTDQDHGMRAGKGAPATTANIHHFFKKCAEKNGLTRDREPVGEAMMKDLLRRLEVGGILLPPETKSYSNRGRTNVYSSEYDVERIAVALKGLGIKLLGTGITDDEFWL